MDILVIIGQLVLSLSILIVLHELGHFIPARLFGTRVEKFYLFFDPWFSLFKYKKGETEYGIGWLPLGGYVKISGMIDESFDSEQLKQDPQPWEFRSKPAWQRLIIMLGGVTVNFILGFLIFGLVLWKYGIDFLPAENVKTGIYVDSLGMQMGLQDGDHILSIAGQPFEKFSDRELLRAIIIDDAREITIQRKGQSMTLPIAPEFVGILSSHANKDKQIFGAPVPFEVEGFYEICKGRFFNKTCEPSPAEQAGVKKDDKIIAINGTPTPYFSDFQKIMRRNREKESPVAIKLIRNNTDTLDLTITPAKGNVLGFYNYGITKYYETKHQDFTFAEAMAGGVSRGWGFLSDQVKAFGQMFKGRIKATESLGGFGSIGKMFGGYWDWERFWTMTATLSLILAFMNLLPIPALDGGHVMFLLYEVISGRKPSDKFMEIATMVGFILVLGLVVFANGLDILRGFK